MIKSSFIILLAMNLAGCPSVNRPAEKVDHPKLADIKLPKGFKITMFASDVDNARSMALGANGTVFIGNRKGDKVYALVDKDKDGIAEKKYVIASEMNSPNGVAFYKGDLYVAEISKVWKFTNIEANLETPPKPVLVNGTFPTDGHHGWKYIAFGPDGKLYVPVGAPCNICEKDDKRYSTIMRMNPDGSDLEVFASGIRNTVGFTWHPETKEMWFTDNGRDMMDDETPPDELNIARSAGLHFGYPYCHGNGISDPKFGEGKKCSDYVKPVQDLAPHTAALGLKFHSGKMFPNAYKNSVFIAEHGSWNRKDPMGYRVMMVELKGDSAISYKPFAEGWLKNGEAWGRPVDVLFLEDGSMLISDDHFNAVYRVTYEG